MAKPYGTANIATSSTSLERQADEANFIVINGLAIDVDDLINAIHGKNIDPILTRAELTTAHNGTAAMRSFAESKQKERERFIRGLKTEKRRRMQALLNTYSISIGHGVTDIKLPRREQILIALSRGRLRYSSLAEFLGQFAELTEQDAGHVAAAVEEVRGDLVQVQAATRISSQKLDALLPGEAIGKIEKSLGLRGLGNIPIFLLERAAFEVPPHHDDYQYFEEIRADRGVAVKFAIEPTLTSVAIAVPGLVFAGNLIAAWQGWTSFEALRGLITSPEFLTVFGGTATLHFAEIMSKWTPITDRLRASAHTKAVQSSAKGLREIYDKLETSVKGLKKTAQGRLRLLALRELLLAHRDGKNHQNNYTQVLNWLRELGDGARAQQFEDFALSQTDILDNFASAERLWSEFAQYQRAVRSLPELQGEESPEDRARRAARAGGRGSNS